MVKFVKPYEVAGRGEGGGGGDTLDFKRCEDVLRLCSPHSWCE